MPRRHHPGLTLQLTLSAGPRRTAGPGPPGRRPKADPRDRQIENLQAEAERLRTELGIYPCTPIEPRR